ncbi:MAG: C-GCAxxG-C-C family protein [Promethearchaeia archaeon]
MNDNSKANSDLSITERFEQKIDELKEALPKLEGRGINCCELTFMHILNVLEFDTAYFHNCAIPLAGGFGGYKSKEGWQGPCGAVTGACMAIGIIMGGEERIPNSKIPLAYLKAQKYCSEFEKEFGSVICAEICGYDFSTPEGMLLYQKNDVWENTCHHFVIWAVEKVSKLMRKDLKRKWER